MIWVKLLGLPIELWIENTIRDLGDSLGITIDIHESYKYRLYRIVAQILVGIDLRE
jgi:hypothetical protein